MMKYMILTAVMFFTSFLYGCVHKTKPKIPIQEFAQTVIKQAKPIQLPPVIIKTPIPFKKQAVEKMVVMLDAGHGGEDFGTHSLGNPKYQEKFLNLSTTLLVKNFLQQFGFEVMMTRTDDTFISLEERSILANKMKPKIFVSIHFNSAPSEDAEGIEVFYYRNDDNKIRVSKSKALAQFILDKTIQNTEAKSRGVKHGNYSVIRETQIPAVLIEGGFLTSTSEMEKIKNGNYLKSLALGIAQGIQEYLAKENLLAD